MLNQRIINTLLLNSSFINNIGLFHGKMGISIFFFHLARQTHNKVYEDYGGELIDEIYEEITLDTPIDFENGLAGVGWGVEYLVQNGFIEADTNEVLEEFDQRIFKELIYLTPQSIELKNGLIGIGAYFLSRIQSLTASNDNIVTLTNKQTIIHLIDEIERQLINVSVLLEEDENFNITWNYTTLIWILTEFYKLDIFNYKIEKILNKLLNPILEGKYVPEMYSKRLLLAVVLKNLIFSLKSKSFKDEEKSELVLKKQIIHIKEIANSLIKDSIRANLNKEIAKRGSFSTGSAGIRWLYERMNQFSNENCYQLEIEYWKQQHFDCVEIRDFELNNLLQHQLGIYEGIAGITMLDYV